MNARPQPLRRRGLALLLVTMSASLGLAGCGNTLTAQSSCTDFLAASAQEQNSAVAAVAADEHTPDAVTPLRRPNIPTYAPRTGR